MDNHQPLHARPICPAYRIALVVVILTVIAGALRLLALDQAPPGLYRDEAINGLDALNVLAGHRPIFFEANNGREPLYIYLLAGAIALWGRSPNALRYVSVLVGTLTIPAFYWLGQELFGWRVGLWAAALAVTSVWMLNLSRVAFRTGTLPLVAALALAAMWRGRCLRNCAWMGLAGALLGLSAYTYLAARFVPIALGLWLVWRMLSARSDGDKRIALWWRGWIVFGMAAFFVSLPLGIYLLTQDTEMAARAWQVSIFNPAIHEGDPWGTLIRHAGRTLRGFAYGGDFIPRHNVPWRPVFTPLLAAAFYGGIGLAAWRVRRDAAYRVVLVWLGTMLLPTILAEDAPHFLRSAGILPVLFCFPALTLDAVLNWVGRRWQPLVAVVLLLVVLSGAWLDLRDYWRHLGTETVYYQFESAGTEMAATINRHLGTGWQGQGLDMRAVEPFDDHGVWIVERLWQQWPSVHFLVTNPERIARLRTSGGPPSFMPLSLLVILWPFDDHSAILEGLPQDHVWETAEGALERGDLEAEARPLYVTLRGEPAEEWAEASGPRWEDDIVLVSAQATPVRDETQIDLLLHWRADASPTHDYSVFRHALCDDIIIGQSDGPPGERVFPTHAWRPGDVFVDRETIDIDGVWDPARCHMQIGLYRWQDLTRLPLQDAAGMWLVDNAIVLEHRD